MPVEKYIPLKYRMKFMAPLDRQIKNILLVFIWIVSIIAKEIHYFFPYLLALFTALLTPFWSPYHDQTIIFVLSDSYRTCCSKYKIMEKFTFFFLRKRVYKSNSFVCILIPPNHSINKYDVDSFFRRWISVVTHPLPIFCLCNSHYYYIRNAYIDTIILNAQNT